MQKHGGFHLIQLYKTQAKVRFEGSASEKHKKKLNGVPTILDFSGFLFLKPKIVIRTEFPKGPMKADAPSLALDVR